MGTKITLAAYSGDKEESMKGRKLILHAVPNEKSTSFIKGAIKFPFPGSSAGKESTCNAEDPSLIPGSERSTGEGNGY